MQNFSDHVVKDAAILKVDQLEFGVESDRNDEFLSAVGSNRRFLLGTNLGWQIDRELLGSGQTQRVSILAGLKLKRDDSHANLLIQTVQ